MSNDDNNDISGMSFEAALAELESIVRKLEEGETSLDDAIGAYERGARLKKHCQDKLDQAKMRVDKITIQRDGSVATEPADL